MAKVYINFAYAPFPETRAGSPIAYPAWEHDEWEPVEWDSWVEAEKEAARHGRMLHENNGGCPVTVEISKRGVQVPIPGCQVSGDKVVTLRYAPTVVWESAYAAAEASHVAGGDPQTAEARIAESWALLDQRAPVRCCLSCGYVGVNAMRGLCPECWKQIPISMKTIIDSLGRQTRRSAEYTRDHKGAIAAAATVAYRWKHGDKEFPRYQVPPRCPATPQRFKDEEEAEKYTYRKEEAPETPQKGRKGQTQEDALFDSEELRGGSERALA